MPISYVIDAERNLVVTTASGTLTNDDVIQLKDRLAQDPGFKPGMSELSDVRSIDHLEVTPAGVRAMVRQDERAATQGASGKLALVVSQDVAYGMARMYQMLTESHTPNVGIFRDIGEARAWLLRASRP